MTIILPSGYGSQHGPIPAATSTNTYSPNFAQCTTFHTQIGNELLSRHSENFIQSRNNKKKLTHFSFSSSTSCLTEKKLIKIRYAHNDRGIFPNLKNSERGINACFAATLTFNSRRSNARIRGNRLGERISAFPFFLLFVGFHVNFQGLGDHRQLHGQVVRDRRVIIVNKIVS